MLDLSTFTAGDRVTLVLTDGTFVVGDFVSTSRKGVNVKVNGKTVTRTLSRIDAVERVTDGDLTSAELAALVGMPTRALRVVTRAMELGVGKGHRYTFAASDATKVNAYVAAHNINKETGRAPKATVSA